jgi:hypothetical protein
VGRDLVAVTPEEVALIDGRPYSATAWLKLLQIRTRRDEDGQGWTRFG